MLRARRGRGWSQPRGSDMLRREDGLTTNSERAQSAQRRQCAWTAACACACRRGALNDRANVPYKQPRADRTGHGKRVKEGRINLVCRGSVARVCTSNSWIESALVNGDVLRHFFGVSPPWRSLQAHLGWLLLEIPSSHPYVARRRQRPYLRTLHEQATAAPLHRIELPLHCAKRMLGGGADRRLDVFELCGQSPQRFIFNGPDPAALVRDVPLAQSSGRRGFLGALLARVAQRGVLFEDAQRALQTHAAAPAFERAFG